MSAACVLPIVGKATATVELDLLPPGIASAVVLIYAPATPKRLRYRLTGVILRNRPKGPFARRVLWRVLRVPGYAPGWRCAGPFARTGEAFTQLCNAVPPSWRKNVYFVDPRTGERVAHEPLAAPAAVDEHIVEVPCGECRGSGEVGYWPRPCPACEGLGVVRADGELRGAA